MKHYICAPNGLHNIINNIPFWCVRSNWDKNIIFKCQIHFIPNFLIRYNVGMMQRLRNSMCWYKSVNIERSIVKSIRHLTGVSAELTTRLSKLRMIRPWINSCTFESLPNLTIWRLTAQWREGQSGVLYILNQVAQFPWYCGFLSPVHATVNTAIICVYSCLPHETISYPGECKGQQLYTI